MLEAPASQLETRMIHLTNIAPLIPQAVAASGTLTLNWRVILNVAEMWDLRGLGAQLTFDATSVTITSAIGSITSAKWGSRILWIPFTIVNFPLLGYVSLSIPGLSVSPGDTLQLTIGVTNSDAVNIRNVTAEQSDGLVIPIRLTENIAIARRLEPNTEAELNALLRR